MRCDYTCARDFFDAVRDASLDADRISKRLDRMRSREGLHAQGYQPRISVGSNHDVMRATDKRIDFETHIRKRREDDYALIDQACAVIYGADQRTGGIGALLDGRYADATWWRYCGAASWPEVAEGTGMSVSWCRLIGVPVALDTVDAYGLANMMGTKGVAEG